MEVKIQIPDNCELIKDGDTYIVKEKKDNKPRSWKEFCERYPKKSEETFIVSSSEIFVCNIPSIRDEKRDRNICTSKEEAEAFLALMQLRQLRKAWIGNWDYEVSAMTQPFSIMTNIETGLVTVETTRYSHPLIFPTKEIASEFLDCFKNLCKTAKRLL